MSPEPKATAARGSSGCGRVCPARPVHRGRRRPRAAGPRCRC